MSTWSSARVLPVDRTIWKDLSYPIQTVALVDQGNLSARGLININTDCWFRSEQGIQSFIIARRNFGWGWGNTPMSDEVIKVLSQDTRGLLQFGSGCLFDNRLLFTCAPLWTEYGVVHNGVVALRFDNISTVASKTNPDWDGLWTSPQIFQLLRGRVNDEERCFAVCLGADNITQVWELLKDGLYDFETVQYAAPNTKLHVVANRIISSFETRSFAFENSNGFEMKRLDTGDIQVEGLQGTVDFSVHFKPDQFPFWVCWHTWTECTTTDRCSTECPDLKNYQPGYRPKMMLPKATDDCLPGVGTPANIGHEFSVCVQWIGKAKLKKIRLHAHRMVDESAGECRA